MSLLTHLVAVDFFDHVSYFSVKEALVTATVQGYSLLAVPQMQLCGIPSLFKYLSKPEKFLKLVFHKIVD
jgi:hypothetical protein